jgi:hypothetical protein
VEIISSEAGSRNPKIETEDLEKRASSQNTLDIITAYASKPSYYRATNQETPATEFKCNYQVIFVQMQPSSHLIFMIVAFQT